MNKLTPAAILQRWNLGWEIDPENPDDWAYVFEGLNNEHGDHPVRAFLAVLGDKDDKQQLDAEGFKDAFEDRYKDRWVSFGQFAEQEIDGRVTDGRISMGGLWEMLNGYVDWDALGQSPEFSDYTEVKVHIDDPTDSSVYVFADE